MPEIQMKNNLFVISYLILMILNIYTNNIINVIEQTLKTPSCGFENGENKT